MISILVTTYIPPDGGEERLKAIQETVNSWKKNLLYRDEIHLHVADDGSELGEHFWADMFALEWSQVKSWSYSYQERQGVGASLNAGFAACLEASPFVLYAVDDWSLKVPLNLNPWVEVLEKDLNVGCFRLGESTPNLAWGYQYHWPTKYGHVFGMWFDPWSSGRSPDGQEIGAGPHYVWCQRPALYHQRFYEDYGPFPERISAVEVDRLFNMHVAESDQSRILLALLNPWRHVDSPSLAGVQP